MGHQTVKVKNDPDAMEASQPTEGLYILTGTNDIEQIAAASAAFFQKLWLYPAKAVTAGTGILTANVGNVSLGKSGAAAAGKQQYCPDLLTPANINGMSYELPLGQKMLLSQIIITGTAGDGVFYSYT